MSEAVVKTFDVDGQQVRALSKGSGGRLLLMVHAGTPGISPFCGSADLFAELIEALQLPGFRIIAPDLPGAGGTAPRALGELSPTGVAAFLDRLVTAVGGADEIHLLAQGESSLAALQLAREGTSSAPVASCFLVAPNAAAPVGDSIENVSLLNPPAPRWTPRSLRWVIRRLAYSPDRVPAAQLESMAVHAQGAAHRQAVEMLSEPVNASELFGARLRSQDSLYAYCRDEGYAVPLTVFWGAADVTATVARGAVLVEILASGTGSLDFQLVNQCGFFAQYDRAFQLRRVIEAALGRAVPGVGPGHTSPISAGSF
ncbi:MAG: alpha/beta fold hydrolase [Actinobacteria bacterium]|nr:alpha/beta fold hydrolase [Actinomycetota bacterium]